MESNYVCLDYPYGQPEENTAVLLVGVAGDVTNGSARHELRIPASPDRLAMELRPTPGRGFHHVFVVLYDANRVMLLDLPDGAALAS
jgi:hypothetical protein